MRLESGQAIYLPAGNLHAYLGGVGLEIMANSDNVIRGGLTPKHVDVAELLRVLTFADGLVDVVMPEGNGPEQIYVTPASEFRLSRVTLESSNFTARERRGPEILLCTEGSAAVSALDGLSSPLPRGASLFVPASAGAYSLTGAGTVFRATVGAL
jgi:mannose-6-phosphate isomerase